MTRAGVALAAVMAVLGPAGLAPAAEAGPCRDDTVEVRLARGTIARFSVEVADDADERSRGLMFREALARSAGMLFLYERPQHAVFWMRNTLIPLDMVFADASGTVTRVHEGAVPGDETGIDGGPAVAAVLEINGGLARRLGIAPGAVMRHPGLASPQAAWPCGG